jgi:hypothetical protein
MDRNPILKTTSEMICVLYTPQDGRIVHTHSVITLNGGQTVSAEEVERRARERVVQVGKKPEGLLALHLTPDEYSESTPWRVDPQTRKLVKIEPPHR